MVTTVGHNPQVTGDSSIGLGILPGSKAAGDLLPGLTHAPVTFGAVVGEGRMGLLCKAHAGGCLRSAVADYRCCPCQSLGTLPWGLFSRLSSGQGEIRRGAAGKGVSRYSGTTTGSVKQKWAFWVGPWFGVISVDLSGDGWQLFGQKRRDALVQPVVQFPWPVAADEADMAAVFG